MAVYEDARARDWVSKYLLGNPAPRLTPSAEARQRVAQLLQSVREEMAQDQTNAGAMGEGHPLQDAAAGNPAAPALQEGLATFLPEEGKP
jgi:hypothetical protein